MLDERKKAAEELFYSILPSLMDCLETDLDGFCVDMNNLSETSTYVNIAYLEALFSSYGFDVEVENNSLRATISRETLEQIKEEIAKGKARPIQNVHKLH